MKLTDFKVISFDCYGTLIDWETGIFEAFQPFMQRTGRVLSREYLIRTFARYEALQQMKTPTISYAEILQRVYARIAQVCHVQPSRDEAIMFSNSIGNWPAFIDSPSSLQYLKQYFKLVILSNVDNDSFRLSNEKLQVDFDYIFTSQDIGSYKPDLRNFKFLISRLAEHGIPKEADLHAAVGLYHDLLPASHMGLATAWIHRRAGREGHGATRPPERMPALNFRFTSLEQLVLAHRSAMGS